MATTTALPASRIVAAEPESETLLEIARSVTAPLAHRSGSAFYSGRLAFSKPAAIYVLGLNPGGSPVLQAAETISADLEQWGHRPANWSRYLDESWRGKPAGAHGMQPRLQHMFRRLDLDLREIPASNAVFVRTNSEAELRSEADALFATCWPFHKAVLERLAIRTVLCLGSTTGRWLRQSLHAHLFLDRYCETNARGWTSEAHVSPNGIAVITVTHPGRVDWRNPAADPTPLVRAVLER